MIIFWDFRNKRSLITTLIRSSKPQYYKDFFNEHCKSAKKTWEGIRSIIKVSTKNRFLPTKLRDRINHITDRKEMAYKFNEFYVNIGNMVEEKIPQAKSKFSDFLKNSMTNSIFLSPVDDKEMLDMFSKIDSRNPVVQIVFRPIYSKFMHSCVFFSCYRYDQ